MTKYAVLLPGDETPWENATPEYRAGVYEKHAEFAKALAERGHQVVGGAELANSRETKQVRKDATGATVVTDGPYAETVEQLTGFYLVESDDLDDLLDTCGILAGVESAIEVRRMVGGDSEA
jgi:hypothetical protein